MPEAYDRGELATHLANPIRRCQGPIQFMVSEQDRIYGYGSGRGFFDGPYIGDLPRAVLSRIRPELERRRAELERRQAEADRRAAEQRAEAERREAERSAEMARLQMERRAELDRQDAERKGEAARREAERKVELARLESERRAEELRQQETRKQQAEAAEKANSLLRDRMFECTNREIGDLVKSGEVADVLAFAAMTICNREVDRFLDGYIEQRRIETGVFIGGPEAEVLKTTGRLTIKAQVVASAVKAKAARASGSSF